MKNRKTNFIKLGMLLFGISLFLFNCEKEEVNQTIENNSSLKTVSKKESITFLNDFKLLAKGNSSNLNYDISKINFEDITNSDSKLTVIPAQFKNSKLYTRILLLKINDTIKSIVYNMHPNAKQETQYFSGLVTLTNFNGERKKAFIYLNGVMTKVYSFHQNNYQNKTSSKSTDGCDRSVCGHFDWDPDCICNMQVLDEIEIKASSNNNSYAYISVVDLYGGGEYEDTGAYPCEVGCNGWNSGGGSGDNDNTTNTCLGGKVYNDTSKKCECPKGKVEDGNGNCIDDPCKKISSQISNANFKAKKEELEKVTSKKQETGYVENKTGTFTKLNPINGGHSLDLSGISYSNINGFIHTHLNNFETGRIVDDKPEINEIYRIFSPADVIAFLTIAKRSTDISNVYATVIASSGDYTLKFTGNQSDIKNLKDAEDYRADYINMMKKGKEKGFLHFLKNYIKIDGIELYKLHKPLFSSTIKVQKKSLTPNGKVDKIECQ